MMFLHPVRLFLAAVALSLLASTTQAEPRIQFAPRRPLTAGEVVTVRWSGLPEGVEEFELLLRRHDGDTVRLTEQLMPSVRSFRWLVPDLPSSGARLVLRAGIDGHETELTASEPFVIRGTEKGARLQFRNGEWWPVETRLPAPPPSHMAFVPNVHVERALASTRRPLLVRAHVDIGGAEPLPVLERPEPEINTRGGEPRTIPQRK